MSEKEKKDKNVNETLEIIKKVLDYNKDAQNLFHRASKVDKRKSKPKVNKKKLNPKIEESIAERIKLKNQRDNLSETPEQKKFNDFLERIKKDQKTTNMNLFNKYFDYESPDKMLKYLHNLKTTDDYNKAASFIDESFINFGDEVRYKLKGNKKRQGKYNIEYF